ncbi:MAG TPA: hypothetical protein VGQ83_31055 [Polyangia bacterium]|jgi:hypothetical protein
MRRLPAVLLLLALAAACRKETPEAAIRRVLDDSVDALEKQDVKRATSHLSSQYQDMMGRTPQQLSGLVMFALRRGPVYIALRETEVDVRGDIASVKTVAYALQRKPEIKQLADVIPQHADRFDLRLILALEGSTWRVRAIDGDNVSPSWLRE